MSFAKILKSLETRPLLVPHVALGMRKPGEDKGIWLFGERHGQEDAEDPPDVPGGVSIDELFEEIKDDTVLLYESLFPPGQQIFADAPPSVIQQARRITPGDDLQRYSKKSRNLTDLDEEGYELNYDERTVSAWKRSDYWEFLIATSGTIHYLGEKFASVGGMAINIENKIRSYYGSTVRLHEEDERDIPPDTFFYVLGWALFNSVKFPGTNPSLEASVDSSAFRSRETFKFFLNLLRNLDERIYPIEPYMVKILAEIKVLLEDDPETGGPLMMDDPYKMRFATLFIFLMMDVHVPERMSKHKDKNFISFCGARHTIAQYVALRHRGYVLEHAFISPDERNFISPSDKKEVSPEIFKDNLRNFEMFDILEYDVTHPKSRPLYRACIEEFKEFKDLYHDCIKIFRDSGVMS